MVPNGFGCSGFLCPHTGSACRVEQADSLPERGSLHAAQSQPSPALQCHQALVCPILTAGWALCTLGLVWSWVTSAQTWVRTGSGCSPHPRHCQTAGINNSWKEDGDFVPKGMNVVSLKPSPPWGAAGVWYRSRRPWAAPSAHLQIRPARSARWGVRPNTVQWLRDGEMSRTSRVKMHWASFLCVPPFAGQALQFLLVTPQKSIEKCTSSREHLGETGPAPLIPVLPGRKRSCRDLEDFTPLISLWPCVWF